jgi:hypothetical protein
MTVSTRPRLRVSLDGHASGPDNEGEERRRQQVADAAGAAAVCHLECGSEAVDRHEAELPGSERVSAAGDQDRTEAV